MNRRRLWWVGAISVLVVFVAYPIVRVLRFERRQAQVFAALELGASRDHVVQLAGQPTYTTDGTRWVEPEHARSKSELIPGCVQEFWYYQGLALLPSKWSYCFAENGALVKKHHWVLW